MITFFIRKCRVLLSFCLILPTFSVFAQQHYSLENLIIQSLKTLPLLHQKQALVNTANAYVQEVKHSFLPTLKASEQLNISTDNSLAGSYFTFGITPSASAGIRAANNWQPATANVAVLSGEYELYNFGLNDAKLTNARSYTVLQQADLQRQQYQVQLEVARLYFELLKNKYRLQTDKENVNRYDSIFRWIQVLTLSGIKAGSDSSLAKAELSKTRITYTQTLGNVNQLKQQLAYYTGIPASQLLIDTLSQTLLNNRVAMPGILTDTLINPFINYFDKKRAMFLANQALVKKSYLPKIMLVSSVWARGSSIQYSDNYKSLQTGLGYQRFNYAVGVAFTYNLLNGLYKKDKLLVNQYQTEAATFELQQQKAALISASLQADNALQTTQDNLLELAIQSRAAQDTYQQKVAQYKAGIISLIDVTNASFVLYRSQTDYIQTTNDWYRAQLDKAAASGYLIKFIHSIK